MGTTLTAKNAGSIASVFVIAIEGYEFLLTTGLPAAAVTAWAVTDWTQALGGAYVDLDNEQSIDPYAPIGGGGKCVIRVVPTAGDRFGIDTHRKFSGAETQLVESIHRGTGTLKVLSTAAFDASGYVYIGTECISYTGKTSTVGAVPPTFTGVSRGRFSPFKTGRIPETNYAHDHRVTLDPNSVLLQPVVSSLPRVWRGRWVAIYEHRVVDGVLDTHAEAHLAFAGRVVDIEDDGKAVSVECEHVLDVVQSATVGRQLWSANVKDGVYLKEFNSFLMIDSGGQAERLWVVSGTPASAYEMTQGYYTNEDLHARIEAYWAQALIDGDLTGSYSIYVDESGDSPRTVIHWSVSTSFTFIVPDLAAQLMGFGELGNNFGSVWVNDSGNGGARDFLSNFPPVRSIVDKSGIIDNGRLSFEVTDERGTFISQTDSLPAVFDSSIDPTRTWGLFLFDGNVTILAAYTVTGTTIELKNAKLSPVNIGPAYNDDLTSYSVPWDDASPGIPVRQILVLSAPTASFLKLITYSTGTVGHNHESFDALELGAGLAIPGSLLGSTFEASCDALPGATESVVSIIDKTTTLKDLIEGDLILRRAFLNWHNGTLRFGSWRVPTRDAATITLDESNKATPADTTDDHRTHSRESTEWQRPIARIYYDRDITDLSTNDGYRSTVTLEDSTAVDDMGGSGPLVTIKVRNAFGEDAGVGANIKSLIANFLATMPMFSRPGRILTRTITPTLVEQIALGDIVLVTDNTVRDSITGIRSVEEVPAVVVRKSDTPGGGVEGQDKASDPTATVELFVTSFSARPEANYAPTADVDDTYDAGDFDAGYNSLTKVLRCYGYRYGDDGSVIAPLFADAEYFPAGSRVRVTERDPLDGTTPQYWDDIVASQSVDDITLTTGLSGWDSTKAYRVTPDTYGDSTTAQRLKSYQADTADALIENTGAPYLYSGTFGAAQYAENMNSTIGIELPPDLHGTDGAGRDVGTEQALQRTLDNFADDKSAISLPALSNVVMTNTTFVNGWKLLSYTPIFLGTELLSSDVWRELALAPFYRSSDGSTVQLRVSLCRNSPSGATVNTVSLGGILDSATWSTTNTNWEVGTTIEVDCRRKAFSGRAWIVIEGTYKVETRGLALCQESERLYTNNWWVPI